MARFLPVYVNTTAFDVTLSNSEAATATKITDGAGKGCAGVLVRGCAGVLVRGVVGNLASSGGKVTVNIYNGSATATAIQQYSVELDFTSTTETSDTQDPGIPVLTDPHITMTADSTANGKDFACVVYLQKIAVD